MAVYDADHLPEAQCFRKAWRRLAQGYHVVQGRCVIRNYAENWLTRTVAVEFDSIYAVSHQGRSNMSGTAIFGGSNGYWRRDALRDVGMNPAMLTEDIDSSVRTLLAGRRLIHDRSIVSYELAPTQPRHWFFQRKRWAQGWLEVTLAYLKALLESSTSAWGRSCSGCTCWPGARCTRSWGCSFSHWFSPPGGWAGPCTGSARRC